MSGQILQKLSIKKKIQLIILFGILIVSLTAFICIHFISQSYEKLLYQSVSNSLSYSAGNISDKIDNIDLLSGLILSDQAIQDYLVNIETTDSSSELDSSCSQLYRSLINYLFSFDNSNIANISIQITPELSVSTSSYKQQKLPEAVTNALVTQALEADGVNLWVTDYCDEYGFFLVRELKQTYALKLDTLGVLMINVDSNKMVEDAISYNSANDNLYLLLDENHTIYQSPQLLKADKERLRNLPSGYQILSLNKQTMFAVRDTIIDLGWDYISLVPYNSIIDTARFTKSICLIVIILCLILTFFISTGLLTTLTYHIDLLIRRMKRFEDGSYEADPHRTEYQRREDEIGMLHQSFDSMAKKIDTLINENYKNEILKRDAQIKAMENQINPHFLYNTLDAINWRSIAIGAEDITKITLSLGSLLRITLQNSEDSYTIAKEVKVLENYITIQKLRYGERLDYHLTIPDEYMACEIPKLTLQPLLENAVHYGLEENSEICHIVITARRDQKDLLIEVKNNGSAFEEDLLEKIESGKLQPKGHGIGLVNISRRLELTYGPAYHLKLYNDIDLTIGEEYAIAQVRLPLSRIQKGEFANAEVTDCGR